MLTAEQWKTAALTSDTVSTTQYGKTTCRRLTSIAANRFAQALTDDVLTLPQAMPDLEWFWWRYNEARDYPYLAVTVGTRYARVTCDCIACHWHFPDAALDEIQAWWLALPKRKMELFRSPLRVEVTRLNLVEAAEFPALLQRLLVHEDAGF